MAVQIFRDIAYSAQTRLEMIGGQHMYLVKDQHGICKVMQLAQSASFIVVKRLEKLRVCRNNKFGVPVFTAFFEFLRGG